MFNARTRFWIAASLSAAVWLTMLLVGGDGSRADLDLLQAMSVVGDDTLGRNAALFTQLGRGLVLIPLTLLVAAMLTLRRRMRAALFLVMVFGGRFLVELQKLLINRDRPGIPAYLEAPASYAFPSAHAANSMITFMAIALLVPVRQRNRAIAVGIALAISLQIGASRVMLGVHWPSDVIGGWAFGLFWVALCMRLANARPEIAARADAGR